MNFSKNDTLLMKGFAIIFLYCYHCFSSYSRLSGVDVVFFPLSQKTGMFISDSMNICVGMFAFLSVFGMTLTIKNKNLNLDLTIKEKIQFVAGRYIGLLGGFWIPFFFCQIVSAFMSYDEYGQGIVNHVCNFILDMFGLSSFFDTPMLTTTWWYLSLTVLFIVVLPFAIALYKKYSILIIPLTIICLLLGVEEVDNMNRWLLVIPLGICFADLKWFQKIYQWIRLNKVTCWIKRVIIYFIFIVLIYLRPHPWGWAHIRLIVNSLIPVIMILILYDCFYKKRKINSIFEFLGRHSANMFYIHTFIREIWFNKLTYSFRYAGLILIFLLIVTICLSILIEYFKKLIRWNDKLRRVKEICSQKIGQLTERG